MRALQFSILEAICLLFSAAFAQQTATQPPSQNAVAQWEPFFDFDGELYPSVVLAMSGRTMKTPGGKNYFGDPLGFAEVKIRPAVPNAQAHVEIQIEGVSQTSALDVTLPEAGQDYRIAPLLRYDYSRLAATEQSIPATVTYSVKVNGSDLGQQTRSIRIRSVNDVPFELVRPDGKAEDLSPLFAGFVNESHPFVQTVLQKALQYHAVNAFLGYQRGPEEVRMQVFALWNVLQRDHIHYSSITTPSASSPTGHVYSQAVRFIDQSVDSQQANCVDGSVLFASLLYKIGIDPILVKKPGHMFVGYFLDEVHKQPEFLETTMLGVGHQPGSMNINFSPVLHPAQGSESYKQFVQAVAFASTTFKQEVLPALQEHKPGYRVIDIAKARQAGINSIPHSAGTR
ncbi:MAG: hypothetical protein DMG97_25605 [Acidobacteria bacterium]|nr:MAG: hypothetical protein DMG97_25605 [Acidobacteriota bacterium]